MVSSSNSLSIIRLLLAAGWLFDQFLEFIDALVHSHDLALGTASYLKNSSVGFLYPVPQVFELFVLGHFRPLLLHGAPGFCGAKIQFRLLRVTPASVVIPTLVSHGRLY